jgi:hypothetical protein
MTITPMLHVSFALCSRPVCTWGNLGVKSDAGRQMTAMSTAQTGNLPAEYSVPCLMTDA